MNGFCQVGVGCLWAVMRVSARKGRWSFTCNVQFRS